MDQITEYRSPIGIITLASDGDHLIGLWLEGQKHFGSTLQPDAVFSPTSPIFPAVLDWLDRYFAGLHPDPREIPLMPRGSAFCQTVWTLLSEIPYGSIVTYGALATEAAARTGKPSMSARAIGRAVGCNPISILIPCHRVVGASNKLTGYAGGIDRKLFLLRLEDSISDPFCDPIPDTKHQEICR